MAQQGCAVAGGKQEKPVESGGWEPSEFKQIVN
jgi:hypothetical protein